MTEIELPQGTLRYSDTGSGDRTIVLIHGLLVGPELWQKIVPELSKTYRVLVPEMPLGMHTAPLKPDADRSPAGLAQLIADFLEALDLHDVTLVGNDSGGLLSQLVAIHHPERIGRLVLTPSDAFEVCPPALFKPLIWSARLPGGLTGFMVPMRLRIMRRLPIAYGWLTSRGFDGELTDGWVRNFFGDRGVRRDAVGFARGANTSVSLNVGARLGEFTKPVLIAWAPDDRCFKWDLGERLATAFPDSRLERIEDAYTFVSWDQPERTAQLIGDFVAESSR